MKVRLLEHSYIEPGSLSGSEHEVDDELGQRLIQRGIAEPAKPPKPPFPPGDPSVDWKVDELEAWMDANGTPAFEGTKAEIVTQIEGWLDARKASSNEGDSSDE